MLIFCLVRYSGSGKTILIDQLFSRFAVLGLLK